VVPAVVEWYSAIDRAIDRRADVGIGLPCWSRITKALPFVTLGKLPLLRQRKPGKLLGAELSEQSCRSESLRRVGLLKGAQIEIARNCPLRIDCELACKASDAASLSVSEAR